MALLLNCGSAVIHETANVASSPFYSQQGHILWTYTWSPVRQHVPQTPTGPSAAAQATGTIIAFGGSTGQGHQNGFRGNMGQGNQYGPWQQPIPRTSAWYQVAAQATHINMAPHPCPLEQLGPQISAWLQFAAQTRDIHASA